MAIASCARGAFRLCRSILAVKTLERISYSLSRLEAYPSFRARSWADKYNQTRSCAQGI
jgi:hypothetical protein